MTDLETIARDLRLSTDVLKRPAELLKQGYDPAFLGAYRPDELGHMDTNLLARLKRGLDARDRLAKFKEKIKTQGHAEGWWQDSLQTFLDQAQSVAEVDGVTRNVRSRKSSRLLAEKNPKLAQLGQAILTMTGQAPANLDQWVAQQVGIAEADAPKLLQETRQWLQVLLSEDVALIHKLGRQILRKASISVTVLADQPEKAEEVETSTDALSAAQNVEESTASSDVSAEPSIAFDEQPTTDTELDAAYADVPTEEHVDSAIVAPEASNLVAEDTVEPVVNDVDAQTVDTTNASSETNATDAHDPLKAFPIKTGAASPSNKAAAKKKVQAVSIKQLSPRQRRRRWLRSILQRYSKLKKPLHRLSHYQTLMLGRGQRSQLIALRMEYDRQPMIKMAREAFCPGNHPLHNLLTEIADESLQKVILPKLEHDVFAECEEAAHGELIEMAVRHLQEMLQRRPVRGHRILVIDAMGQKTAAVAIVGPRGQVEFTADLNSVSSRPDVVSQNVVTLGQWIHQYKVSLVALSNGNTRRYLIQTVNELMKQSGDSGLRWTLVDRTGADSYCDNRQSMRELPKISKRHRAAVWIAWRLQDPLIELTKVDPARLRLGSYQRELPQDVLESALLDAVSTSVASRGVDVWNSHEKSLICLPGIDQALARAIVELRDQGQITTREALFNALRDKAPESQLRQAIGYLRVFDSQETLDGTMIHPDDYRLAERLVTAGQLAKPPVAPEGWQKPTSQSETPPSVPTSEPTADETPASEADATPEAPAESVVSADIVSEATTATEVVATSEEASTEEAKASDSTGEATATETNSEPQVIQEATSTEATTESSTDEIKPVAEALNPECPTEPTLPPALSIDVEKLARSWQVGREKMRMVARCLQLPFADPRDAHIPIPLLSQVPTLDNLKPGMTAWGIVMGVADFGAFVDLGPDCNGLIHVSKLSRDFVEDPHEVVQLGDLLQVWVLSVDHNKKRIALSALPPGVEQARHPSHQDMHGEQGRGGFQGRGQQQGSYQGNRPRFQDRGPSRGAPGQGASRPEGGDRNRSHSGQGGGQRTGQSNQFSRGGSGQGGGGGQSSGGQGRGNFQGRSQQRSGSIGGGGRGRNDRDQRRRDEADDAVDSNIKPTKQNKPPKAAPPITEGMQQGIEPMRSFSDLLQFYQVKRDEGPANDPPQPAPPPAVEPPSNTDETPASNESSDQQPS